MMVSAIGMYAQPGATTEDLKKPEQYENRKLGSDKTGEKKFTKPRRIYQNTVTHYNYYFNANNRLNDVLGRAKLQFKDDYTKLLSFYNYSLDATATETVELDSIIYKCTAGILLHDLRSDWVDNMYTLMGKAYFLRKDFDSAGMTWQYLNYAFAPKDDGYDIPIGSNSSNDKGVFSIATKEKRNWWKKMTSRPPSRNESFLWIIRNYTEQDQLPEAAGLMEILRNDPNFPKRLQPRLHESLAYWFYKQTIYDSAAFHLSKALSESDDKQEKARWQYLIGQMYQLAGKYDLAVDYYEKAIKLTTNPVMDVYARLNAIRINKSSKKDYLQENINDLVKMAKKDKYENYRDIIYYAAAKIETERNNFKGASEFLAKSIKYSATNPPQKSQSFLLLADLNYDKKQYIHSYNYYDSTDVNVLTVQAEKNRVTERKPGLKIIAENTIKIQTQDSLQALAALPADKRDEIIRKEVKRLRKLQGLKDEGSGPSSNPAVQQTTAPDLFGNAAKGDFYFYNAGLKGKGFSEFKAKWGDRPNVDGWRRMSAINKRSSKNPGDPDAIEADSETKDAAAQDSSSEDAGDISYASLLAKLPLSSELTDKSNRTIMEALFKNAKTFQDKLEDIPSAIAAYEELLRRFPNSVYKEEVLFNLVYCYKKDNQPDKSTQLKRQMQTEFPKGKFAFQINNPKAFKKDNSNDPATKKYEEVYNLFIEGKFEEAKNQKRNADSIYGPNYWTPQLLFIESIYYVKQREDSVAINRLIQLKTRFGNTPLGEKATTLIDVLGKRKEIEDYLTNLEVKKSDDGSTTVPTTPKPVITPSNNSNTSKPVTTATTKDSAAVSTPANVLVPKKDSSTTAKPVSVDFNVKMDDAHFVAILLDKVDEVYIGEARNAFNRFNKEKYYNQKIDIITIQLDDRYHLLLQGPFKDVPTAHDYVDKTKPQTSSRIVPWLAADKYSYIIISQANLDILSNNKKIDEYRSLLKQLFADKY
jgi:tetratricopeptide (TPR) repeat protein